MSYGQYPNGFQGVFASRRLFVRKSIDNNVKLCIISTAHKSCLSATNYVSPQGDSLFFRLVNSGQERLGTTMSKKNGGSKTIRPEAGQGLGDAAMVAVAQAKVEPVKGEEFELCDPFSLIDYNEMAQEAQQLREQEGLRAQEVVDACAVAEELINAIAGIEQFFYAGDKSEVETVKSHPESKPMKAYAGLVQKCQAHFKNACVEKSEGKYRVGSQKPHCVIPARLSALKALVIKMSEPRAKNDEVELRGLFDWEISAIAVELGVVVEVKEVKGPHIEHDKRFFVIGKNGDATEGQHREFEKLVGLAIKVNQQTVRQVRKDAREQLKELAPPREIEKAMREGGQYLANVPSTEYRGKIISGGLCAFLFEGERVTIGGNTEICAEGPVGFVNYTEELRKNGACISVADVTDLLKGREHPPAEMKEADKKLWWFMQRHCNWLQDFREEEELIDGMVQDSDLTSEDFLEGETGEIVLRMESFHSKAGKSFTVVTPAAIRVKQLDVDGKKGVELVEGSPRMMPLVSSWVGKAVPMDKLTEAGDFGKFVRAWTSQMTRTATKADEEVAEAVTAD